MAAPGDQGPRGDGGTAPVASTRAAGGAGAGGAGAGGAGAGARAAGSALGLLTLTVLAAAVRLPTLAQQSFWLDEGYTVRLVRMSLGAMLRTIPRTESTPPAYYVLAWVWTRLFGSGEYGLRSLSALAGVAAVPVVFAAGRRLAGPRAGAVAGLLVATSPLLVWFSQEARAYALAALLSAITLLCVIAHRQDGRSRWLAGWALAAGLGLATHYFVAFVVAPEVALLWWGAHARPRGGALGPDGRGGRALIVATVAVGMVALALVPLALAQRGTGHADYIAQGSVGARLVQVPKQFLVGYASPGQTVTAALAALLVLAGGLWALIADREARGRARAPLMAGIAAVVAPAVLAVIGVDFLDTRNVLPALPLLDVALAVGFTAPGAAAGRRAEVSAAALTALAGLGLVVVGLVVTHPRYQRDDWRGAGRELGAATAPRVILVTPGSGLIPLQAYLPRLAALATPAAVTEVDVVAIPAQQTGAGIGTPPRPAAPLALPAGFRLARAVDGSTFTVLRYRAPAPVAVTPALTAADHLGPGSAVALVQRAPGG